MTHQPPRPTASLAARIRARLPTREMLTAHPWLQPIAERLLEPKLWRLHHESVARGVAVGMFWAFVIPVGQIVVAAVHCTWWRANIPVAAASTMLTNPLTIGFWLWLAYHLGVLVLGEPLMPAASADVAALSWLAQFGWPTVLGMGLFAVGGAVTGYFGVKLVWRMRIWTKRAIRARKSPAENSRA
jgi:uncharacterized protein